MQFVWRVFATWLPLFIVISCLCGIIYLTVQQNFRLSANDPQIQMAEDTAQQLGNQNFTLPSHTIDIARSLQPFLMTFDTNGKTTSSQATLNNRTPVLPSGVFATIKQQGETRFTWQPQEGVRIATVVVSTNHGYVLAGRNLREVENREQLLELQVFAGWLGTIILTFVAVLFSQAFFQIISPKKNRN